MLSVVASAAFWPLLLLPGRVGYSTATDVEEGVRVSYVLTVYNKSRYLPFVIEGLRRQEGDFDREFIFVDDGSTDDSVELIERLTTGLPGVTIHRQPNQGPSVAMNVGFSHAKGDYIKPVDADDILFPWTTRVLLDALAQTGCKVSYAHFDRAGEYDSGATDPAAPLHNIERTPGRTVTHPDLLRDIMIGCLMTPASWLARTDIVRQTGGCDERIYTQDYGLNIKLARLGPIAEVQESLYLMPADMGDRNSGNPAQERHDEAMILARFIEENPSLAENFERFVFNLALKKLWHWRDSQGAVKWLCREYWFSRLARAGMLKTDLARIDEGCRRLRRKTTIKVPGEALPSRQHEFLTTSRIKD